MIKNPRNLQVGDKIINILTGQIMYVVEGKGSKDYPVWIKTSPDNYLRNEICLDGRNNINDIIPTFVLFSVANELGMEIPDKEVKEKVKISLKVKYMIDCNDLTFIEELNYKYDDAEGIIGTLTFEED